ncbi:glycosaminoglycan xylosylkinase [Folsomia candida]|uniref:Glycosaminoglycan xylosylkinase n=1 Tax=Folsomia candida TaxID=158441 RepID=A0A226E414_FOLCA|nr:glycosaminoglycan xylosylkinase [Folsomia candida]OXA52169.1 Glycosaminoglycan xylosylkinase [Folsomia candida]
MVMVVTKQRLFQFLLALILVTLVVNGYTFFLFLTGYSSGSDFDPMSWASQGNKLVVENSSVPSIRFKICDNTDRLVILVGSKTNSNLVQIVQRIRFKYLELGRLGAGRKVDLEAPPPPSVTRLQRLIQPSKQLTGGKRTLFSRVWESIREWPFSDSLRLVSIGQVLSAGQTASIRNATNAVRGTQLKVEVTLEGGQVALWKPQAYPRNVVLEGNAYGGKDRHYGEIAAFYLNLLLGYNNAPITTGRRINFQTELWPVASPTLKDTFFKDSNGSLCFYGVCHFCSKTDPVCEGDPPVDVEGALVLWMQRKFQTVPNPWRRTYQATILAPWESSMDFCSQLMRDIPRLNRAQTLLDIVGVAVFDFLIGNGDRHHFEMYLKTEPDSSSHSNKIILFDNGKSFGNPFEDYVDILAPLFQCCKIRKSLHLTLKRFEGKVGFWLDNLTRGDPLYPLLTEENLSALDRRLRIVLATVNHCKDTVQQHNVKHNPSQHKKLFY